MENNFDLSRTDVGAFVTFFQKMACNRQTEFVKNRRSEIVALQNVDIFSFLCSKGYYIFLLPLMEIGDEEDSFDAFATYYGRKRRAWMKVPKADEIILMKKAAKRFDMMYQLRENTEFFIGSGDKTTLLRYVIYENASPECLNYLLNWVIKNSISITKREGLILFGKADAFVLRKYITKISHFTGSQNGVSFPHIQALFNRSDLSYETKMELICLAINHFPVNDSVIGKMRKAGLFFK